MDSIYVVDHLEEGYPLKDPITPYITVLTLFDGTRVRIVNKSLQQALTTSGRLRITKVQVWPYFRNRRRQGATKSA